MVSLNAKERKMLKYIKKNNGASAEELENAFGKKYIETLNSLLVKKCIHQTLAEDQPYFNPDNPPGCISPSIPRGKYIVTNTANRTAKKSTVKKLVVFIPAIMGLVTAVIGLISQILEVLKPHQE